MPDNSIILSAEQRDAYRLDAELKHNAQTVIGGIIEIGRCLKEINDRKLYEYLGFSGLAEYAESAVGLKERAAYNYITAYETYGEQGLQQYGQLGITKLVALAQLNDEDRTEMLESGKAEELSTRKLNDEIKKLKGENDQLVNENNGMRLVYFIASVILLLLNVLSWGATCFIAWLVCSLLGLPYSVLLATGIWLVIVAMELLISKVRKDNR